MKHQAEFGFLIKDNSGFFESKINLTFSVLYSSIFLVEARIFYGPEI